MPPAFERVLDDGLREPRLVVPGSARRGLTDHVRLLLAWNRSINLTAVRDPAEVARLHVLDSLTALPLLRAAGARRLLDLGSGGGFPGLPLALALPAEKTLLVESIAKKARFLAAAVEVAAAADFVAVATSRAEALARDASQRGRWEAVTARAVGALPDLVELALPLLGVGGTLVAWKRGDIGRELAAAERAARELGGGPLEVAGAGLATLSGHVLVLVRKTGASPERYPRDPAVRRRFPWQRP
jgi:16S rRNA (guanine527-N7)-methyltransferase